ncbi:transglycosylase domain-containing protein [Chryseobacterium sp. GP-SGM7]|uniref:transglycosylase domain-containing protein n=1 Tax=Chryseobacterium sp. GP-SGM7 TaxID=3411323 RepID=UPI003B92917A
MKYLKKISFLILTSIFLFILYLEFGGNYILDNKAKRTILLNMRVNKKLPQNVTRFYNTIYKNSLSKNSWNFFLSSDYQKDCPCYQMSHKILPTLEIKNVSPIDYFHVTRYIERNFTQTECLSYNLNNFDFLEKRKGIDTVSKSLFNKSIENLEPLELAEVFAIYEQPLKNNRNRNPEKASKSIKRHYNIYLKNLIN